MLMHDSCKNHPKMLKLCRENYVHDITWNPAVFLQTEQHLYIIYLMNHYPSLSCSSSLTSHNKPKAKLEKAVTQRCSIMFFLTLLKFTRKHLNQSFFFNKTADCRHVFFRIHVLEEQIMFVRISVDTISSLTTHCINQFSKQTKWLWWQNQMCISGKK